MLARSEADGLPEELGEGEAVPVHGRVGGPVGVIIAVGDEVVDADPDPDAEAEAEALGDPLCAIE